MNSIFSECLRNELKRNYSDQQQVPWTHWSIYNEFESTNKVWCLEFKVGIIICIYRWTLPQWEVQLSCML